MNIDAIIRVGISVLVLFAALSAYAQDEATDNVVAVTVPVVVDKGPEDALGRGNPRSSIVGFLDASSAFNWEKASEYLDLRNLPADIEEIGGPELARQFTHVISRTVWLDQYSVSDSPEGLQGDDLPGFRDELFTIRAGEVEVPIWLQRIPRADGVLIWKISNRSVARIPELYDAYSYPALIEKIRNWFPENASLLGLEAFKWFIMLAIVIVCWPVYRLIGIVLSRLVSSPKKPIYPLVRKVFIGPVVAIGLLVTAGITVQRLGAGAFAQEVMRANTLFTAAIVWALWSVINLIKMHQQEKLTRLERPGAAKLMQPLSTLAKIFIFIFGLLFWLNNIGVNITTVLAGLGVGGLAVALALQKPIEDMMGALTIFSQAPIRVGDFCRYGTEMGVVEDIGLRTTRFRTLTNTIVSIPNSRIASVEVENLSYRTKIRYWPTLRLRYDTSPQQMRQIMDHIRESLEQHELVHDDPLRVRFTDFHEDAVLIKINAYVKTTDFNTFLEIAEELNFRIMEIVQASGASFALPGRSIFLEGEAESVSS